MSSTPHIDLTDIRDAQVAVIVSVAWAGRTWSIGNIEVVVGTERHILPGLLEVPEITDAIDLSGGGADAVSVSLSLALPAEDIASLVAAGFDLIDAQAEVSLVWHRGGVALHSWAARHVVADGDLRAGHYGAPDKPAGWIAATVEDSPYVREVPLVAQSAEVSASTWSGSPDMGARYPLVFGRIGPLYGNQEGYPQAPVVEEAAGVPITVLVSSGYCVGTQVYLLASDGTGDTFPIAYRADGLGQVCAVVDLTAYGGAMTLTGSFQSLWLAGQPALCPFDSVDATAVHLAAYLLALGGADLDLPEWIRIGCALRISVAGYTDDAKARAWEPARDLIAGLPIGVHRGDCGWAPVLLDPHGARDRVVARVREGDCWRRASQWQTEEGTARVARVEVSYVQVAVRVGAGAAFDGPRPHAWVRHLPRPSEASVSLSWAIQSAAAHHAAAWLARSQALGWRVSAWQVAPCHALVRAGEWVELIETSGATRYALVMRRTLSGGIWDYALAVPGGT